MEMIDDGRCIWLLPRSVALMLATRRALHILPVQLELSTPPLAAIWRRERTSTQQIREFASVLASVIDASQSA
jgi:DNA-binding transcriptional LysR family regulator